MGSLLRVSKAKIKMLVMLSYCLQAQEKKKNITFKLILVVSTVQFLTVEGRADVPNSLLVVSQGLLSIARGSPYYLPHGSASLQANNRVPNPSRASYLHFSFLSPTRENSVLKSFCD